MAGKYGTIGDLKLNGRQIAFICMSLVLLFAIMFLVMSFMPGSGIEPGVSIGIRWVTIIYIAVCVMVLPGLAGSFRGIKSTPEWTDRKKIRFAFRYRRAQALSVGFVIWGITRLYDAAPASGREVAIDLTICVIGAGAVGLLEYFYRRR